MRAISEICSAISMLIKLDPLTANKGRLLYARVFVEVSADKPPPNEIHIIIEGKVLCLPIEYEWIPPHCDKCFSFGHISANCVYTRVWIPKTSNSSANHTVPGSDSVGARPVGNNGEASNKPKADIQNEQPASS